MRHKTASRLLAVYTFVVMIGLAGCGSMAGTGGNGPGTPTEGPGPGQSATPTPGQVRVAFDKTHYGIKDTINVAITNGLAGTIYSTARYTNCTIVSLQWQSGTNWAPWAHCTVDTTKHFIQLKSNTVTALQLTPTARIVRPANAITWQPGTYRLIFSYNTIPDDENAQGIVVASGTFTIG